jgi:hypothetical protein
MRPRYAPRHLSVVARRLQLLRAGAAEARRLAALVEPAAPTPVDDEGGDTVAVPFETMAVMVFGSDNSVQEAA